MPVPEVLTWRELREHLGSRHRAAAAVDDGSWQRVLRGAYTPGGATVDADVRVRAVLRLLPEHAYVADRCLLWLYGLDVQPPGRAGLGPLLEVVVPRGRTVPRRAGLRAREAALPASDRALFMGVRSLRLGRAVADLLRRLPLAEGVVVADAVQHAALGTADAMRAELASHTRLRGVRTAYRALDLSSPLAESPPESRLRLALQLAGQAPVPQYEVRDQAGRWLARVDLAFPQQRVAVEYDGRAVHERSDVFVRDRRRQNDLVRAGWVVLRYTADDLRFRMAQVVSEVAGALRAAA